MKKPYMKPAMQVVKIQHQCHILTVSGGGFHTDDPQPPGGAMSREYDWDDEW